MATSKSDVLRFQPRDLALLRGLFESRIMTAEHIAALFFNGSREAAKKRLQKLKAAGFIGERKRKAYEPAVLSLTPRAFAVLHEQGILAEYHNFRAAVQPHASDRLGGVRLPFGNVHHPRHTCILRCE